MQATSSIGWIISPSSTISAWQCFCLTTGVTAEVAAVLQRRDLYQDALAAYAHLVDARGIDPGQIVLFGRSLGAAVAGIWQAGDGPPVSSSNPRFPPLRHLAKDTCLGSARPLAIGRAI